MAWMTYRWRTLNDVTSPPNPGGAFVEIGGGLQASEPNNPYAPGLCTTLDGKHARLPRPLDGKVLPCSCGMDAQEFVNRPACKEWASIKQELRDGSINIANATEEDQA